MPTATLQKFNAFTSDLGKGLHNLPANSLKVALTNTAPAATAAGLSNISQIAAGGGYVAGGYALTGVTWTTAAGVAKLGIADLEITATGAMGSFRYGVVYNDSATGKPVIGFVDYGSSIAPQAGEKFRFDFSEADGVLTVE